MASEGWCRGCGEWWAVDNRFRLPSHRKYDRTKKTKVLCRGSGKVATQIRPKG